MQSNISDQFDQLISYFFAAEIFFGFNLKTRDKMVSDVQADLGLALGENGHMFFIVHILKFNFDTFILNEFISN